MSGTDPGAIPELFEKLNERFLPTEVKQRPQGGQMLDYLDIATVIGRFNSTLGANWSQTINSVEVTPAGAKYLAVVSVTIHALGSSRAGVGADIAADVDKAVKTALAEAIKKAGHQFGVGLYLWDAEERAQVDLGRKAAGGDLGSLKKLVAGLAEQQGVPINPDDLAKHFKIKTVDLNNAQVLKQILDKNGVEL